MAWFGCIDCTYTLLLRFTFWGASSKSDYLVTCILELDQVHREKQFFPVLPHNVISLPLQCLKEWQVLEVRDTEETQFSRLFTLNRLRHVVKTPASLVMIILRAASMASQIMSCLGSLTATAHLMPSDVTLAEGSTSSVSSPFPDLYLPP